MFERTDKGLGDFPKTLKDEPNPNWQNCQFLGLENSFKNRKMVPPCYACQFASLKSIEGIGQDVKKIGKDNL